MIFFARADYLIIWMSCLLIGTVTDLALANTARRTELLASPLLSPAWPSWRKLGSDSQ